jgi:hypothetical protein
MHIRVTHDRFRLCIFASTAFLVFSTTASAQSFVLTTQVSPAGGGTVLPSGGTFVNGTQVTLLASPNNGFRFDHWEEGASGTTPSVVVTMDMNRTVRAVFVPAFELDLSVTPTGGGSVESVPEGTVIDAGQTVTLTATAAPGFRFFGWRGDLGGSANPESIFMSEDRSVTAIFLAQYTLEAFVRSGDGSIIVTPAQAVYDPGQPITLTASPFPGWRFDGWHGGIESDEPTIVISLDRNLTVFADFVPCPTCECGLGSHSFMVLGTGFLTTGLVARRRLSRRPIALQ